MKLKLNRGDLTNCIILISREITKHRMDYKKGTIFTDQKKTIPMAS